MADVFKGPSTSTVPKNDPRVIRVDFNKSDLGARKSNLPTGIKNDNSIKHVNQ